MQDLELQKIREEVQSGYQSDFTVRGDGMLQFQGRVCVPAVTLIKELIL